MDFCSRRLTYFDGDNIVKKRSSDVICLSRPVFVSPLLGEWLGEPPVNATQRENGGRGV